jgi:5-methyltetrahydrofolate--homocysteine methyltransferase
VKTGPFQSALRSRVLVSDGAKGTMLQSMGLGAGECPDSWNISGFDAVRDVHRAYAEAGAEILVTNTFNSLPCKLAAHDLSGRLGGIVSEAVRAAREGAASAGARVFVAGSVPPTGRFIKPLGGMEFDEAAEEYRALAAALAAAGADLFWLETFTDIVEIKAAMVAIREVSDLPIVAMMTFDSSCRTVLGTPPQAAAVTLEKLGACAVGANCSVGPPGILDCLRMMHGSVSVPLVSQPNAGLPVLGADGVTRYSESPAAMAEIVPDLIAAGARIIGGCCGTTPAHVAAQAEAVKSCGAFEQALRSAGGFSPRMLLASRTRVSACGPGEPPLIIGERINPTGRRKFGEGLLAGDMGDVAGEARAQGAAGAGVLDVNVGVAGGDERLLMRAAVRAAQSAANLPVAIDTTSVEALEEGLKCAAGRPLVNSANAEEARLVPVMRLAKKYGAAVVCLCLDENGIPAGAAERKMVADRIERAAFENGMAREDLLFDFLTLAAAAMPGQAEQTLSAVREARSCGRLTVLGVSNVSYGLPARDAVNASFISMALEAGLDAAIMNPGHAEMTRALAASALLSGRDPSAQRYLSLFRGAGERVVDSKASGRTDAASGLGDAVISGDAAAAARLAGEALAAGMKPVEISSRALLPAMAEVGRLFRLSEIFLPQVMLSAEAMQAAMGRLEREMEMRDAADSPLVILATVEGDIHDLGKGIVAALLRNSGFRVHDAGKGVSASTIVELARKLNPACVGLSALMTTTMVRMREVVAALKGAGLSTPVMVGGAVLTREYASSIGAHYGADAVAAVELAATFSSPKGRP